MHNRNNFNDLLSTLKSDQVNAPVYRNALYEIASLVREGNKPEAKAIEEAKQLWQHAPEPNKQRAFMVYNSLLTAVDPVKGWDEFLKNFDGFRAHYTPGQLEDELSICYGLFDSHPLIIIPGPEPQTYIIKGGFYGLHDYNFNQVIRVTEKGFQDAASGANLDYNLCHRIMDSRVANNALQELLVNKHFLKEGPHRLTKKFLESQGGYIFKCSKSPGESDYCYALVNGEIKTFRFNHDSYGNFFIKDPEITTDETFSSLASLVNFLKINPNVEEKARPKQEVQQEYQAKMLQAIEKRLQNYKKEIRPCDEASAWLQLMADRGKTEIIRESPDQPGKYFVSIKLPPLIRHFPLSDKIRSQYDIRDEIESFKKAMQKEIDQHKQAGDKKAADKKVENKKVLTPENASYLLTKMLGDQFKSFLQTKNQAYLLPNVDKATLKKINELKLKPGDDLPYAIGNLLSHVYRDFEKVAGPALYAFMETLKKEYGEDQVLWQAFQQDERDYENLSEFLYRTFGSFTYIHSEQAGLLLPLIQQRLLEPSVKAEVAPSAPKTTKTKQSTVVEDKKDANVAEEFINACSPHRDKQDFDKIGKLLEKLLKEPKNINYQSNTSKVTPLMAVIGAYNKDNEKSQLQCRDMVKKLIEAKADVTLETSDFQYTALQYAVSAGDPTILQHIFQASSKPDELDQNEAFKRAIKELNSPTLVQNLIEAKANMEAKDLNGITPLLHCANHGHYEHQRNLKYAVDSAAILKSKGARMTDETVKDIIQAISSSYAGGYWQEREKGHREWLRVIHSKKEVELIDLCRHPFYQNNPSWELSRLQDFLRDNKDNINFRCENEKGDTPVMLFLRSWNDHLSRKLSSTDQTYDTAGYLLRVFLRGEPGINLPALYQVHEMDSKCSGNEGRSRPLNVVYWHIAERGIDSKDKEGNTLLMLAAKDQYKSSAESVIRTLVQQKASVDARDNAGLTPLMAAAKNKNESLVKFLIESKADVHAKDNAGNTPSMIAAAHEVINLLKAAELAQPVVPKQEVKANIANGSEVKDSAASLAQVGKTEVKAEPTLQATKEKAAEVPFVSIFEKASASSKQKLVADFLGKISGGESKVIGLPENKFSLNIEGVLTLVRKQGSPSVESESYTKLKSILKEIGAESTLIQGTAKFKKDQGYFSNLNIPTINLNLPNLATILEANAKDNPTLQELISAFKTVEAAKVSAQTTSPKIKASPSKFGKEKDDIQAAKADLLLKFQSTQSYLQNPIDSKNVDNQLSEYINSFITAIDILEKKLDGGQHPLKQEDIVNLQFKPVTGIAGIPSIALEEFQGRIKTALEEVNMAIKDRLVVQVRPSGPA